jgi:hypothetical protein
MWNGFVGKQINRSNRNMVMANLGLLAVPLLLGGWGLATGYWKGFIGGPVTMTSQGLDAVKNVDATSGDYVSIKGDKTIDTGMTEITETTRRGTVTGKRTSANFVGLKLNEKILIVKAVPESVTATQFAGRIKEMPSDVYSQLIAPVLKERPDAKDMFYPYMLDQEPAHDYNTIGYVALAIGVPCGALAIWNLTKVGRRWGKPENHPIAKQLGTEPATVAATIEQEVAASNSHTIGKTTITSNWLFRPTTYGLQALRLEDLVWFYQKVTTHRTNGIPTGKTYSTVLYDRAGRSFEMNAKEAQVENVMTILYDKAPWAVTGYSDELQAMWKKQRASLVAQVDERRAAA